MKRATKRQMLERAEDIMANLREGRDPKDFLPEIASKFNCTPLSVEKQYNKFMRELAETQKERIEEVRLSIMMRLEKYEREAASEGKIKTALDAVNLQAKVAGLYNPPKAEDKSDGKAAPVFEIVEKDNSVPSEQEDEGLALNG